VLGTLAAVVVIVGVIAGIAATRSQGGSTPSSQSSPGATDSQALVDALSRLDPAVVAAVGSGGVPMGFSSLHGAPPLVTDGRPQILYVGADYCPYCAAQRWSMIVALSRFGSFSHLSLTTSSSTDVFPDTATFSFRGSSYTSRYVDFVAVEEADRTGRPQQTLSPSQASTFAQYSVPPYVPQGANGGIPWLDIGNRNVMVSSGYSPQVLAGLSWSEIVADMRSAGSPVAKGVIGNANEITAAICKATGMQPAAVCGAAPIAGLVALVP